MKYLCLCPHSSDAEPTCVRARLTDGTPRCLAAEDVITAIRAAGWEVTPQEEIREIKKRASRFGRAANLSAEDRAQLLADYVAGVRPKVLAQRYGLSTQSIGSIRKRAGVPSAISDEGRARMRANLVNWKESVRAKSAKESAP